MYLVGLHIYGYASVGSLLIFDYFFVFIPDIAVSLVTVFNKALNLCAVLTLYSNPCHFSASLNFSTLIMKCSGFGSNQGRRQSYPLLPPPSSLEFSDCAVNNSKAPSAECLPQVNSSFGNFPATEWVGKLFGCGI